MHCLILLFDHLFVGSYWLSIFPYPQNQNLFSFIVTLAKILCQTSSIWLQNSSSPRVGQFLRRGAFSTGASRWVESSPWQKHLKLWGLFCFGWRGKAKRVRPLFMTSLQLQLLMPSGENSNFDAIHVKTFWSNCSREVLQLPPNIWPSYVDPEQYVIQRQRAKSFAEVLSW